VKLPPVDELDAALGTARWKVRKGEAEAQLAGMDARTGLVGRRGRKPGARTLGLGEGLVRKPGELAVGGCGSAPDW